MNKYLLSALVSLSALLSGCLQHTDKLRIGMSRPEVIAAMGKPNSVSGLNGYEILNYNLNETSGSLRLIRPYHVRLLNGTVDAFGFAQQLPPMRATGAMPNNTASLRLGMTKDEAIATMGKPEAISAERNVEYLNYTITDSQGSLVRARPYQVRLVDGKVDSFGFASPFLSARPLPVRQ
jgi:hypothetical protein